jgi:glycosyltransferase involved in cell wall biosynthesis
MALHFKRFLSPVERMRVLQVGKFYPPFMGGMETHLQTLCEYLQSVVDVQAVVFNNKWRSQEDWVNGVRVLRAGTLFTLSSAPVSVRMAQAIRAAKADVVHLHLPNPLAVLAYLLSGHEGELVVTYHSDVVRQRILGPAFQPILKRVLDRAAAIITTSPTYAESSPVLPHYTEKCRVIPFGIQPEQMLYPDRAAVARIREEFGPRIVVSVGRLVYYKGFEYLIRAMAKVRGTLLIAGEGPLRGALEQEAKASGVADRVVFLGRVQDVVPYYHASDLFVLPSIARSEAFGIVQLEAMACGKPVINTQLKSGVPFVSLDRVTGLTVPPADADALARAINKLLGNRALREEYGAAAHRRVYREFSQEVMIDRTYQLYTDVLSKRAGALASFHPFPAAAQDVKIKEALNSSGD